MVPTPARPAVPAIFTQDLYRLLVQSLPNTVSVLFDHELRVLVAAGTPPPQAGLQPGEPVEGRPLAAVFTPELAARLEVYCRAALAGAGGTVELAWDGRVCRFETRPLRDEHGAVFAGVIVGQDITTYKQTEHTLRLSQQRYEQLVNTIDGIVWEGDARTFQFFFISQQAERLLGYPAERWVTEPTFWRDHIHPDDRDWALNFCVLATAQKRAHEFEYRMIAADGRVVWLRDIVTVVVENDQPVTLRGVMLDITEKKRAEDNLREAEQQYRSIFNLATDGLFINDLDGHLVTVNPAAAQMHGYTVEEFMQLQPHQFVHPNYLHLFHEYIATVKEGREYHCQAVDVRKDGSTFHVKVTGIPFTHLGKPHTLAVVRDITQEVEAFQRLEERVAERTRELAALLKSAQTLVSTLELKPLLDLILDQLKEVVDYTGARLFIEERPDELVLLRERPASPAVVETRVRLRESLALRALLRQRQLLIVPDTAAETPLGRAWPLPAAPESDRRVSSWMAVPLLVKERAVGLLRLEHSQPGYYDEARAKVVRAFAYQAAIAIENARLYEQAQQLAALEERQKLARELHDSVSQALYGIALGARTARSLLDREAELGPVKDKLANPLDYVLSLAEAGLAEMRALIFELRPESLEAEGLVAALNKQAASLRARHNLQVSTVLHGEPAVALPIKETLYRIAQEALHNVAKHARASQVTLDLECTPDRVRLTITDDGVGFDARGDFPGHLGLRSMRERVQKHGGSLIIDSAPGQGTRLAAEVPL